MTKTFEIDYAVNKNFADEHTVVQFVATSGSDRYEGVYTVATTDDAEIARSFDWHLADHIRAEKEFNV